MLQLSEKVRTELEEPEHNFRLSQIAKPPFSTWPSQKLINCTWVFKINCVYAFKNFDGFLQSLADAYRKLILKRLLRKLMGTVWFLTSPFWQGQLRHETPALIAGGLGADIIVIAEQWYWVVCILFLKL